MSSTKRIQNLKQDRSNFMDNENHKNIWNNLTKFVLYVNSRFNCYFSFNGDISFKTYNIYLL